MLVCRGSSPLFGGRPVPANCTKYFNVEVEVTCKNTKTSVSNPEVCCNPLILIDGIWKEGEEGRIEQLGMCTK